MRIFTITILFISSAILLLACQEGQTKTGTSYDNQENEEKKHAIPLLNDQEPAVLADTFFFGCAYLDENNNGELDDNDPPIGDMTFTITLNGGGGFGGRTPESGCTTVVIPGGLANSHWPVKARMLPPEGSEYQPIGPEAITLERTETHVDFLFSNP